ncbi:unnamed protein product, partial [Lampetra planeri]
VYDVSWPNPIWQSQEIKSLPSGVPPKTAKSHCEWPLEERLPLLCQELDRYCLDLC